MKEKKGLKPILVSVADIDNSKTVYLELSNPYYKNDECNIMEMCFQYPNECQHIIQTLKLAVRCGLQIKFSSQDKQVEKWVSSFYEYYRS